MWTDRRLWKHSLPSSFVCGGNISCRHWLWFTRVSPLIHSQCFIILEQMKNKSVTTRQSLRQWRIQGLGQEAIPVLAPVISFFTGGRVRWSLVPGPFPVSGPGPFLREGVLNQVTPPGTRDLGTLSSSPGQDQDRRGWGREGYPNQVLGPPSPVRTSIWGRGWPRQVLGPPWAWWGRVLQSGPR